MLLKEKFPASGVFDKLKARLVAGGAGPERVFRGRDIFGRGLAGIVIRSDCGGGEGNRILSTKDVESA